MAKKIAVVIQEDPRKTHRPVEALRIALGLVAGGHETTVVLLNEAVGLIAEDPDEIVDLEILEKYLPSIEQLEIPFILSEGTDPSMIRPELAVRFATDEEIRTAVHSMDRTLVF
jgi:hypothetical protein